LLGCFGLAESLFAQAGNDNPGGVTNEYHGSSELAGQLDPCTGNARREIDDVVVTGSVGAYPLKFTRILTTRGGGGPFGEGGGWSHSYGWSLWVRPPDQNYCGENIHADYCGPLGGITYPGGAGVELWSDDPVQPIYDMNGKHGPIDKLMNIGNGYYELRRGHGGKVLFRPAPVANTYQAYQIIDPFGQVTTLDYDASGKLTRVTEPGGRYLEFFYQTFSYWTESNPSMLASKDVISTVRSNDGRGNVIESVSYEYEAVWITYAASSSWMYNLKHVYYNDSTASYNYIAANTDYHAFGTTYSSAQVIQSCDDPRYVGPMKQIQYLYVQRGEAAPGYVARGQVKAESNVYGQIVTQVTFPTAPNDPALQQRTETRGDGQSRFFNYLTGVTPYEFSSTSTDFRNQTFTDTTVYNLPGWRITDPRSNASTYETEPVLGVVRKITHPGVSSLATREYTFTDAQNPYYHSAEKDENYNWTYFDRDGNNRVWQTRYPDGGTEQFYYNGFGQVVDHRLTSGGWEHIDYDNRGLKTSSHPPATPSDPDPWNHPTRFCYYTSGPNTDRLQHVNDPYGNATWYEYNQRGQVTKVTHQDGTYTQSGYNPDGTLAWNADENHPGAAGDPSQRTRYTYDEYKRVLTVTNPMGETTTNYYGLDWANPLFHTTGTVKYTLSPMGRNVVYDYDANFRKIAQTVAAGTSDIATTWFEYDQVGNLTKTTDPRGNVTAFGYDERNRRIWMDDPIATDRNSSTHTMNWGYDFAGNKTSETRADNASQYWVYDTRHRLYIHYDFAGLSTIYDHDYSGTVIRITDPKWAVYSFGYDALNRKTGETYPADAYGINRTELFWYDIAGNLIQFKNPADQYKHFSYDNRHRERDSWWDSNGPWIHQDFDAANRLANVTTNDGETTVTFGYDDANRKVWEDQTLAGYPTRRVSTHLNHDGARADLSIYTGGTMDYGLLLYDYNQRGQLAVIAADALSSPWFTYRYDASGNRTKRQDVYAGVNDSLNMPSEYYDGLNRPTMCENTQVGDAAFARSWYQYDKIGREVATWRDEQAGQGERYWYNETNQVIAVRYNADQVWTESPQNQTRAVDYTYTADRLNRAQVNDNGAITSYGPNGMNQYTSVNGATSLYDQNFNLYTLNGWRYDYNADKQLLLTTNNASTGTFVYDGLGRCVKRTINGVTVVITYDGWKPTIEWDANASLSALNVYGTGPDEILYRYVAAGNQRFRYHHDIHGNVIFLLDFWSSTVVERYTYDAFGKPTSITDWWGNGHYDANGHYASWYDNRFMFQGREYIAELGIYDYRHRMYQPGLGRFLQTDPTGFDAGDMNLFRYCGDDPVDGSDPTGLMDRSASGSTIEERMRLFYGNGSYTGSLFNLDHSGAGVTMASVRGDAENSQGGVRHGDGYGSSPVEAGLQREGDAKKIARGDSEGVTEIGQDQTNPRQFYSPPAHGGNKEVSNFTDGVKKDKAPVAVSYVDPARLPNNYKLVGGVVGYRLFSAGRAREDIQRAKNAGLRTFIMTAPERKVPVIYDKYTDPNPTF
jgi:RHS repeat-associated protein